MHISSKLSSLTGQQGAGLISVLVHHNEPAAANPREVMQAAGAPLQRSIGVLTEKQHRETSFLFRLLR
jgi:hypothetical protein